MDYFLMFLTFLVAFIVKDVYDVCIRDTIVKLLENYLNAYRKSKKRIKEKVKEKIDEKLP